MPCLRMQLTRMQSVVQLRFISSHDPIIMSRYSKFMFSGDKCSVFVVWVKPDEWCLTWMLYVMSLG